MNRSFSSSLPSNNQNNQCLSSMSINDFKQIKNDNLYNFKDYKDLKAPGKLKQYQSITDSTSDLNSKYNNIQTT